MKFAEFFQDDTKVGSISRLLFAAGMVLTPVNTFLYCYYFRAADTQTVWSDALICGLPGLIGLAGYVFGKLYDARTLIAEIAAKLKK
jgi:hypothetical protein